MLNMSCLTLCYTGDPEDGRRILAPIKVFGPPPVDTIAEVAYPRWQASLDPSFPARRRHYGKSGIVSSHSDEAMDTIMHCAQERPSTFTIVLIEHFHGAYHNALAPDAAWPHRHLPYDITVMSQWAEPGKMRRRSRGRDNSPAACSRTLPEK
jgi:hypothetical protein